MNKKIHSLALLVNLGIYGVAQAQEPTDTPVSHDDTIVVTAAEQNLQAPGVSTITADEIRKNPVARDVSEIIRTMPGVNLTGNSTSGQRGNNRQIDIRGMGPENTLILIDGKPVSSRNSVRQGWRGERDTRSNPLNQVSVCSFLAVLILSKKLKSITVFRLLFKGADSFESFCHQAV